MRTPIYKAIFLLFISILLFQNCKKLENTDIKTSINQQIQQVAFYVLENQLKNYDAKSGSVLVMEVSTGKIKAMVNLTKTDKGNYKSNENDLLNQYSEPGSIFMPISLLTAVNDGFVDEKTTINTENGQWNYENQTISDGLSGGIYKIDDILAHSSNVGMAKIVTKHYENQPEKFYKYLQDWKFSEKLDDGKLNNFSPELITQKDKNWSKTKLASASYGYSLKLNALQVTNFYNAIANNGKLLKPVFIENQKTEIWVDKIASERSLQILKDALVQSVEKGTPKNNSIKNYKIAGKYGTTRLEYWKSGQPKYQASFVGFYPAENPKYTIYVAINEPNLVKGYYGAIVAFPVFLEIAELLFDK